VTTRSALAVIDQAYNRQSWHGTNLRGSIRGITAREAAQRPGRGRHNIWELVVHAAYWKYVVLRRLTGDPSTKLRVDPSTTLRVDKRGSFELAGSNFFLRPERGKATDAAWRADIALLDRTHQRLRAYVSTLSSKALAPRPGRAAPFFFVTGIAAHDLYHAGQIQLIKRLIRPKAQVGSS
jgi:hypothetical protein